MNRLGTKDSKALYEAQGWEWNPKWLGLSLEPIIPKYTRQQEKGYWLLLGQWVKIWNKPGVTKEDFHDFICKQVFGEFTVELPSGETKKLPIRTTTKRWDAEQGRYIGSRLRDEAYSKLIEQTYRIAAEGGVVLPDLDKERAA